MDAEHLVAQETHIGLLAGDAAERLAGTEVYKARIGPESPERGITADLQGITQSEREGALKPVTLGQAYMAGLRGLPGVLPQAGWQKVSNGLF